ncbi:MAG: nitroreductase [Lachnospiraceae bacterium]|jgi:nitroreductase|nr:nitroreductase [Lachnospiraceae bacterium]
MEALECIKTRRSIRKFTDTPVSKETLTAIVEAASMAPSWKNTQIARYNIVENADIKNDIATNATLGFEHNRDIINGAPQLVVVSMIGKRCGYEKDGSFTTSKEDRWEMFDAGIASQTFCLAAHDMGIGSVIMGIFDEDIVSKAVSLPEGEKVAALIAIGYPDQECAAPKRKTTEELMRVL